MPIVFEENRGQWNTDALFVGSGHGLLAGFDTSCIRLGLRSKDADGSASVLGVDLRFADANSRAPRGEKKVTGARNYMRGDDPKKWQTNVCLWEKVRYDDLYPGVSVVIGDNGGRFEYDLELADAMNLEQVRVNCDGVESIELNKSGELEMRTKLGTLCQSLPKSWYIQPDGTLKPTECRFRTIGEKAYGFELVKPEGGSKVVVDPGLNWSTFVGGTGYERVLGIDLQSGLVTVVGVTDSSSSSFPITTGAFQTANAGMQDAFVTRFNPALSGAAQLVWSTFLGGSNLDEARGVAVQSNGIVAFCGWTRSTDFPVTGNAKQTSSGVAAGVGNGFISRLSNNGATLLYSTYHGGTNGPTNCNGIAIDATGLMTVCGRVDCSDLPLVNAYDTTYGGTGAGATGPGDGYVAQINPNLAGAASFIYGTYLGGTAVGGAASDYDEAYAVDVESGLVYVAGSTVSPNLMTTATAFQPTYNSVAGSLVADGFVAVLNPAQPPATQLTYLSYFGSASFDEIFSIKANLGVMYFCGYTEALHGTDHTGMVGDFPTSVVNTPGIYNGCEADAAQSNRGAHGVSDAFVAKLDPSSTPQQLRYSTFIGGQAAERAQALARLSNTSVVFVGYAAPLGSLPNDYPVTGWGYQTTSNGQVESILTRLDWSGGRLGAAQITYSTFLGGTTDDVATAISINVNNVYIGGYTNSSTFPTAGNPYDSTYNGPSAPTFGDGFACNIEMAASH